MTSAVGSLFLLAVGAIALGFSFNVAVTHQVYTEAVVAPPGPSALSSLLSPSDPVAQAVSALDGPGLLQPGSGGAPILDLASSWKAEDGGSKYAFTLSPHGRWSDGQPITTRDVAFTLAVLQAPNLPNAGAAVPWTGVSLYSSSMLSGVFVLPGPSSSFPAAAEASILPAQHYHDVPGLFLRGGQHTVALFPPSAGPFVVTANAPDQVTLGRNAHYRPRPILSGFDIRLEPSGTAVKQLLAQGTVDGWLAATPGDLSGLPNGLRSSRITTYAFVELLMNEASPPLNSLPVRQALAATIERQQLIKSDLDGLGQPQFGPLPDSIALSHSGTGALEESGSAGSFLRAAGWSRQGRNRIWTQDGRALRLVISVPEVDPLPIAASALSGQLQREGILSSIRTAPETSFVAHTLTTEDFQAAVVGFDNGPDPDLTALWGSGIDPGQSLNFSQAQPDPYLNHALAELATAATGTARAAAYKEVARRLFVDVPAVFLYTPVDVYLHLSSVHCPGVPSSGDPTERFRDVVRWSL